MPTVTLTYNPGAATPGERFIANPPRVPVRPSDTISFQLDTATLAAIPGCRLRITLQTPLHFAAGSLQHSAGKSGVVALQLGVDFPPAAFAGLRTAFQNAPATHRITHYKCELLNAAGATLAEAGQGGEIVPDITS